MEKDSCINKMNNFLQDTNIYKKELKRNPLKQWQTDYNKKLKSLLQDYLFKSYLLSLSKLYELPKIHKNNVPMRPIISAINSVSYKLAGWLSKILTPTLNRIAGTHPTNKH